MINDNRPDIFSEILNKTKEQHPNNKELQDKITLTYFTLHKKVSKRKGRRQVLPELNEEVLLKCQTTSDAVLGITAKFIRPFDGRWVSRKFHHHVTRYQTKKERLEGPSIRQLWKNI
jgi:hypothetical protein